MFVTAHLRNFNEQHLILAKFYISKQSAEFLAKFTKANNSYSAFCKVILKYYNFGFLCMTLSSHCVSYTSVKILKINGHMLKL